MFGLDNATKSRRRGLVETYVRLSDEARAQGRKDDARRLDAVIDRAIHGS